MRLMQTPQRRILSKFQVGRFSNVSVMSHRTGNLSASADGSIVLSGVSADDDGGAPQTFMDRTRNSDDDPGRLVRQGTFPLGRSSLRKQGSMKRTKSFRVTFAEKLTTNNEELANVYPPVTPPSPRSSRGEDFETSQKASTSKQKITNRKKPARRPTSHVPRNVAAMLDDDLEDKSPESSKGALPSPTKADRRTTLSQFLDQNVLNPMEEKLRQLSLKYRKPKPEAPKSRIPVPTNSSFKPTRVSSLASKYERQFNNGENK